MMYRSTLIKTIVTILTKLNKPPRKAYMLQPTWPNCHSPLKLEMALIVAFMSTLSKSATAKLIKKKGSFIFLVFTLFFLLKKKIKQTFFKFKSFPILNLTWLNRLVLWSWRRDQSVRSTHKETMPNISSRAPWD
jgi:hypothetical protein